MDRKQAVETLETIGRKGFTPEAQDRISRGQCIGHALAYAIDSNAATDAAMELLEAWNGHLSVACIDAIEHGKGQVTREGRTLTIILPEHWAKI